MNFPKDPVLEVVFIGEAFYNRSGTAMSSIYVKRGDHYSRFDWGFAKIALERGQTLNIRPATKAELDYFAGLLGKLIIEQNVGG